MMAILGNFSPATGILTLTGDNNPNSLTISRDAAGTILANAGAIAISGGVPTVANTSLIQIFGLGGNDNITLDETNGALPAANVFGGNGNDTITGGSGNDQLFGQAGDDTLLGKGGFDFLFGGSDNDVLIGGDDDDQMFGEGGDDRMIWNPGDDTDLHEGGAGNDTTEVNGGGGGEVFTATANGTRVRFDRLDPAPFSIDIGTTENLVVNMNGGDDSFSATGNLAGLIKITVDGGAGNDTILGSNGNDTLLGGDGDDFIDGQQGDDFAALGAGNDVFQWDPGDGSDTVEGQAGTDTLLFNGGGGSEIFEASANGGRVIFTRNLGNIVMDLNDVEKIELNALGNADSIVVNNLAGTDVGLVDIDLAGTIGGSTGDGQVDTVTVNGSNGANNIEVLGSGTSATLVGLAAQISIGNAEGALDKLVINGLGGNDVINAATLPAGVIGLTVDGGAGNDTFHGSDGVDLFLGGDGNDFNDGNDGDDVALMGAGNDVFQWDPGDDNDTIEGQDGTDELRFNGANVAENIDIVANGERALFLRNIANVVMDLNDVERITFNAFGGADNVVVGDMSGTDVNRVTVNLGGDGAVDTLTSVATNSNDTIFVATAGGVTTVSGIQAQLRITGADGNGGDQLTVNALGGDDTIDASGLQANRFKYTANGGLGEDFFIGSAGNDVFNGGDGDDTALMGAGNDTFIWNPGDDNDLLEGQAGTDTMLFNGANIAESIDISANGGRATFFRNVASVTMDLNDVEHIDFNALGGADNVVINDMSGTDVSVVNLNLGAAGGGGDGQVDTITINATNGDDVIQITNNNGVVTISGLAAEVNISNFDADDRIVINGLGGDDVIEASGLTAGILLTADGGNDDDVLVGGAGDDTLLGGAGDDVLVGGGGLDLLDGGPGDNIVIQGAVTSQTALLF
jgi:Ca2+-binding RTX toxin-like protein